MLRLFFKLRLQVGCLQEGLKPAAPLALPVLSLPGRRQRQRQAG
jgi:hypothetical protein